MSGRMDLEDRKYPKRERPFEFYRDDQVKKVTPAPYRRLGNTSKAASAWTQNPRSFSYGEYAMLKLQTVRKFHNERKKYLEAIHGLDLDAFNQGVNSHLVEIETIYYERQKYLRPIHRRLLQLENQHAKAEAAQILREIYYKHEEGLEVFHRCLLELHGYDATSKSLEILKGIYDEHEEDFKAFHRRLLRLYQPGGTVDESGNTLLNPSRHDATRDPFEALAEIHDEQDNTLERLHSHLLDRPRQEGVSRLLDPLALAAIDASLGPRAGNYQSGKDLKVLDGRLRTGPRYKGTAFWQSLRTLQPLYDGEDFEKLHRWLLELCKPSEVRESLACDSRSTTESSVREEIGGEVLVRDSISKPVEPTSSLDSGYASIETSLLTDLVYKLQSLEPAYLDLGPGIVETSDEKNPGQVARPDIQLPLSGSHNPKVPAALFVPTAFLKEDNIEEQEVLVQDSPITRDKSQPIQDLDSGGVSVEPSLLANVEDNSESSPRKNFEPVYPEFDLGRIDSIDETNHNQGFHRSVTSLFQDDDVEQEVPIQDVDITGNGLEPTTVLNPGAASVKPSLPARLNSNPISIPRNGGKKVYSEFLLDRVDPALLGGYSSFWSRMSTQRDPSKATSNYESRTAPPVGLVRRAEKHLRGALKRFVSSETAKSEKMTSFMEPQLEEGKVRVRWTCRCGRQLYDDFVEIRPGAAKDLAKLLDHPKCSPADSKSVNSRLTDTFSEFMAAASSALNSSAGMQLRDLDRSSTGGTFSAGSSQGRSADQQPNPDREELEVRKNESDVSNQAASHENLFLLTCISIGRYATGLLQLDLKQPAPIVSDRQLLELLRTKYHQIRRDWRRTLLSFQTLTSIEFVQFELHRKSLVDIRKRDDIPPADRSKEYRYQPVPAEVIPPVGKNFLMHIYNHPEDADQETVCLTRFPKRIKERLQLGEADVPIGWGIEFVEGIHWNKVWCFGFAIVILSLSMGIVWSYTRKDVQGGFGIAGFMMAFLMFTVGMVQAANA